MRGFSLYTYYLRRFYQARPLLLTLSVTGLMICYLTLEVTFSFGSIVVKKTDKTFEDIFADAKVILSPPTGLRFDKQGQLASRQILDTGLVNSFLQTFRDKDYRLIAGTNASGQQGIAYLYICDSIPYSKLLSFSQTQQIPIVNSFYQSNTSGILPKAMLYNISGSNNRYNIYPFAIQLSAAVLGRELSSDIGKLSRLLFIATAIFTLYVTMLYYRERKTEYTIFIIQGHTDLNLKITLTDCLVQNIAAFIIATCCVLVLLSYFVTSSSEYRAALGGLWYLFPWLPIMVIVQLLILLNQAIKYAASFR